MSVHATHLSVRLSERAHSKLLTLKRRTSVAHVNVLCRWAFCASIADPTRPSPMRIAQDVGASNPGDVAMELPFKLFGGQHEALYRALLIERCHVDGLELDAVTLREQLHLHILRGIIRLAGDPELRSLPALMRRAALEGRA